MPGIGGGPRMTADVAVIVTEAAAGVSVISVSHLSCPRISMPAASAGVSCRLFHRAA